MGKELKKLCLKVGSVFFIMILAIFGIYWYADRQPIQASEYSWIDSLVEQCPKLYFQVELDLEKGYITESEDRALWKEWRECRVASDEQRKKEIIKKYIKQGE